jgi:hypothetical protein
MKKILFIIILNTGLLVYAQDRYVILDKKQADTLKQYQVTHWWGIDPVELKDGTFVLNEKAIKELDKIEFRELSSTRSLKQAMEKKQFVSINDTLWKDPEPSNTLSDEKEK